LTLRVDAHQHYWDPRRGDYGWMPPDDPVLTRPYGPADLAPALAVAGIDRTVLVQAAATVAETDYLLAIAEATPSVGAVVGWIDFADGAHLRHLERLRRHPKFAGLRPMIQDIPDPDWMLRDDVQWACAALADLDLTFDALGFPRHLAPFLTLLRRHPKLRVVIDHAMKPPIRDHGAPAAAFAFWADGMKRLAGETGAFCKLSGLVTEAGADWRDEDLAPYAAVVLDAFGPARVMWGSDWPVCRLRCDYARWHATAQRFCAYLTEAERAAVFGGTAARFYKLADAPYRK
jgi:L-fucono-1,5-lactonase